MKININTLPACGLAILFSLWPCGVDSSAAAPARQQPQSPGQATSAAAPAETKRAGDAFNSTLPQDKRAKSPAPAGGTAATTTTTTRAPRPTTEQTNDRLEADETRVTAGNASAEVEANRREGLSEEERVIVPYYNNFMSSYRLGPEDVISVRVFGQERYSLGGIIVPPDGIIAYPLIKEGVSVAGKTTRQIADEITKHLDEYIIDPKVSVSLDKAQSAVFSVMGDVGTPGIRPMVKRLSVREAIAVAGGILPTGKRQVTVYRTGADGMVSSTTIDIAKIEKGKIPDNYFLSPGDQVFVPGNKFKTFQKVIGLVQVISFANIFRGGWF